MLFTFASCCTVASCCAALLVSVAAALVWIRRRFDAWAASVLYVSVCVKRMENTVNAKQNGGRHTQFGFAYSISSERAAATAFCCHLPVEQQQKKEECKMESSHIGWSTEKRTDFVMLSALCLTPPPLSGWAHSVLQQVSVSMASAIGNLIEFSSTILTRHPPPRSSCCPSSKDSNSRLRERGTREMASPDCM